VSIVAVLQRSYKAVYIAIRIKTYGSVLYSPLEEADVPYHQCIESKKENVFLTPIMSVALRSLI